MTLSNADHRVLHRLLSDLPDMRSARGRQALVENAIAGYPKSARLMSSIDWEGSATVVTTDLLRWLDGYEVADDIEALPLLVIAIQPLVPRGERAGLTELAQRQGWSTDPQTQRTETWLDSRTADEVVRERIIGENTLRHINYLQKALRAADAVVRIAVPKSGYGTGFMVAADLMMTNHHVIADDRQAAQAEISFHYELGLDSQKREPITIGTADNALVYTDAILDVSLVRLRDPPASGIPLPLRAVVPEQNQRVAIIQHPGGFWKKISLQSNFVASADQRLIQYYTSTQEGSSGSPVLDDDFAVIGVHHGYVGLEDPDPKERSFHNQGSSMIAILNSIEAHAPSTMNALTILD